MPDSIPPVRLQKKQGNTTASKFYNQDIYTVYLAGTFIQRDKDLCKSRVRQSQQQFGVKGLALGPDGNLITLLTMGFGRVTF